MTSFTTSSTRPWNAPFSAATVSSRMSCSASGPVGGDDVMRDGHEAASAIASRPSLRRERDERAEELELARVDDGDVHGRPHDLAVERCRDLLGDHDSGAILRLGRRSGEVRRDDDLRQARAAGP